ncbi:hypothetical protein L2E82_27356 [Cichorium intybus]|uniref:Uncharacterized protein n=1 Tax=Cichorium intybus TaxID=13427 RepID=A0ACB9CSV9_CICIN|nr:hypothetical protein L2E82_27356 [Cichorium intybus]
MAIAQTILTQALADEIALVDVNADKLRGEMLDLQHAATFLPRTKICASVDYSCTFGSDLVIVTAGARQITGESRLNLLQRNLALFSKMILIADHLDLNAQDVQRQQIAYEKQTLAKIHKEVVEGAYEVIRLKGYTFLTSFDWYFSELLPTKSAIDLCIYPIEYRQRAKDLEANSRFAIPGITTSFEQGNNSRLFRESQLHSRFENQTSVEVKESKAKADAVVSKLQTSDDQKKDVKPSILIASDTNCSNGLTSINRRLDNRMNFARQDSKSQAKYMSLPSSQPPKFARTTVETNVPMKFIPYNNTHATKRVERKQSPRMDVAESGGKYILLIEFPGVSKDDIRVEVNNTTLTVQTTKGRTVVCSLSDGTRSVYHKREILEGPFEAMWPLPFDVNSDSVSAEFL